MCFVLLTINLCCFFFHKYSLKCMALFFLVITYDDFFSINIHWNARLFFLTFTLCSLTTLFPIRQWNIWISNQGQAIAYFVISIDSYHLGRVRFWVKLDNTLYFSVPLNVEFYSGENAVDTITPLTRTDIKSWTSLILGPDQIPAISFHWLWSYLPLGTGRNALDTIAPVFLIGSSSNLQVTSTGIKYWMSLKFSHIHVGDIRLDRIKSRRL